MTVMLYTEQGNHPRVCGEHTGADAGAMHAGMDHPRVCGEHKKSLVTKLRV